MTAINGIIAANTMNTTHQSVNNVSSKTLDDNSVFYAENDSNHDGVIDENDDAIKNILDEIVKGLGKLGEIYKKVGLKYCIQFTPKSYDITSQKKAASADKYVEFEVDRIKDVAEFDKIALENLPEEVAISLSASSAAKEVLETKDNFDEEAFQKADDIATYDYEQLDANKDGIISIEEAESAEVEVKSTLNKDEEGNIQDTAVVDLYLNTYKTITESKDE